MTISKSQQILSYIKEYGPATAAQIGGLLNTNSGNIGGYCAHLLRNGSLKVNKDSKPNVYYLPGQDPNKPTLKPAPPFPTLDKILAATPVIDTEPRTSSSLDSAIDALATALVGRISEVVEDKVSTLVETIVAKQVASSIDKLTASLTKPEPLPKPKVTLPKVLVCGLLPDQQQMITKEYSGCLDMRYVGTNDNPSMWKSKAAHADQVFVMTSFVSHSHTEAIESVGVKPVLVSNGMSTLRDVLTRYYAEVA